MRGFIKISNEIFDFNLSPKSVILYAFMVAKQNRFSVIKNNTIADLAKGAHLSPRSVQAALAELETVGIILKQNRKCSKGYLSSRYHITEKLNLTRGWFPVEREIFDTNILPTDFVVFCFIRRAMNSATGSAFPSLNAIASGTGISRSRCVKATAYLKNFTFINKIRRQYKRTAAFRHNRYLNFTALRRKLLHLQTDKFKNPVTKGYHLLLKKARNYLFPRWYYFCQTLIRRTNL